MAQLFVKVEMTTFVYDEHLQFMEILQNPTKHMSRAEQRKQKLIDIGVDGEDIVDQVVEDSEIVEDKKKMPKKLPKPVVAEKKDPKQAFAELGFQVYIK